MTISERDRHHLHTRASGLMGDRAAEALMGYLPPVGWADVATKRDLDALEERMDLRFQLVDQRFDAVDQRFESVDQRFDSVDRRLDSIVARLDGHDVRFGAIEQRFGAIEQRFGQQTRTIVFSVAALNLSFGALVLGVVQTLG
jgi:hypothetical protein